MRIAETTRTQFQQFVQPSAASRGRQASDVSREERVQLLTKKTPSHNIGSAPATYSERAQLLSVSTAARQTWVA